MADFREVERLPVELPGEPLVLPDRRCEHDDGAGDRVVGDPAGVGRIAAEREELLFQQRRRLQRDVRDPDEQRPSLPGDQRDPLGVGVGPLELPGDLGEVVDLEDPDPVPGHGRAGGRRVGAGHARGGGAAGKRRRRSFS